MKIERTKNATQNMFLGLIYKIYAIVCPFIIRTTMIYYLGMQYVGLSGLFSSVLQVLNLTELGVGVAMVYSMYRPIAEDNQEKICALMQLYKKYYRIIGCVIAGIGILIVPLIPRLVSGELPDSINLYVLYLLNLFASVFSYWLYAYKNALLQAHQRIDVINIVSLGTNTIQYVLQILVITVFKNYYLYLILAILGQILTNIITAIATDRIYPHYKACGNLDKTEVEEINQRIKDLFTAKVGGVIQNSFDSIIISAFLGLTILGQYNNYYYIMSSVFGFVTIAFNSVLAGIGNSIIIETEEKNYRDFLKLFFIIEWFIIICTACFTGLYQPFMKIWVGDQNMLNFSLVICLVIYFICITTNQLLCVYKDGSGIWHQDRFRPLVVALINLALNLSTVKWLGLFGVVLSTVISMAVVGMPWLTHNLFNVVFKRSPKQFIRKLIGYLIITFTSCVCTYFVTGLILDVGFGTLFIKGIICLVIPNVIFIPLFHRTEEFHYAMGLAKKIV